MARRMTVELSGELSDRLSILASRLGERQSTTLRLALRFGLSEIAAQWKVDVPWDPASDVIKRDLMEWVVELDRPRPKSRKRRRRK